jgi:hypothetical protein
MITRITLPRAQVDSAAFNRQLDTIPAEKLTLLQRAAIASVRELKSDLANEIERQRLIDVHLVAELVEGVPFSV